MGTGTFPGVKSGRGLLLTSHPLLVPRSRKSRALPLLVWTERPTQSLSTGTRAHFNLHVTFTLPLPYFYLTFTLLFLTFTLPLPYFYLTFTLPLPYLYLTFNLPLPYLYLTFTLPLPYLYLTFTLPLPYLYLTFTLPLPYF